MVPFLLRLRSSWLFGFLSCTLICSYFCFQVELFDEEYEANNPSPPSCLSFARVAITWETVAKHNAEKTFVFNGRFHTQLYAVLPAPLRLFTPADPPFQLIRDKSPPRAS